MDPHTDPTRPLSCATARDLVSAAADDEASTAEHGALDAHLAGCAACSGFAEQVASLTRRVRVRPATADPALVARIVADRPGRLGRGGWLRPALAWVALVVAVQSFAPLVLGELDGAPAHVARHVGASALALATSFLVVAWRPRLAAGMLPYAVALGIAMSVGTAFDIAAGHRSLLGESVHLAELVGLLLLWAIAGSPGLDRLRPRRLSARAVAPSTS